MHLLIKDREWRFQTTLPKGLNCLQRKPFSKLSTKPPSQKWPDIHQSGGNLEEAKDIFHDALIIYYEKMAAGKLQLEKSEEAYILGIGRHLWSRKFRQQIYPCPEEDLDHVPVPEEPTLNELKLLKFLETAGKKCMQLLEVFYYKHMNFKKISAELGYATEHSAAVQKYKCIEKIRGEIKQKSMTYEDFFE